MSDKRLAVSARSLRSLYKDLMRNHITKTEVEWFAMRRVRALEESLRDCASKLEYQVSRNPELPERYSEIVKEAFELLNADYTLTSEMVENV